jgi:hypothetical protein
MLPLEHRPANVVQRDDLLVAGQGDDLVLRDPGSGPGCPRSAPRLARGSPARLRAPAEDAEPKTEMRDNDGQRRRPIRPALPPVFTAGPHRGFRALPGSPLARTSSARTRRRALPASAHNPRIQATAPPKIGAPTKRVQDFGRSCARHDSNMRPLPPQGSALSPELRALGDQSSELAFAFPTASSASVGTSRRT